MCINNYAIPEYVINRMRKAQNCKKLGNGHK